MCPEIDLSKIKRILTILRRILSAIRRDKIMDGSTDLGADGAPQAADFQPRALNPRCVREYDIRGVVDRTLSADDVRLINLCRRPPQVGESDRPTGSHPALPTTL